MVSPDPSLWRVYNNDADDADTPNAEAPPSNTGLVTQFTFAVPALCPGDADGDGDTDISDLGLLLANFGAAVTPGADGDLNFSGLVDITDLGMLLADFGCAP